MYRYDSMDTRLVRERVEEFRGQVQRRVAGALSEDEFRPLRLMNGLYLQRHAYMLRISIPYGLMTAAQVRKLGFVAERYDRGFGHFTTRQNIQLNWIRLEETPDILSHLAEVGMHAIQTSGNCVRNVSSDPEAGVARDELLDVRPYCELLRQYKELHPEFMFLPRKFKVAFSGAATDRAATTIHDVGFRATRLDDGTLGWKVYVGGGLGRTPRVAQLVRDFLPLDQCVSYLEAILRVYNLHGRRDNKYRARIKILVGDLGVEAFRDQVEAEWAQVPDAERTLAADEIAAVTAMFDHGDFDPAADAHTAHRARAERDPAFARWLAHNVRPHKAPGYNIVYLSLKHPARPPGDASSDQLYAIADLAERYNRGYVQATYTQNVLFQYIANADLEALYDALTAAGLATANVGTLQDLICCPGLDYCSLANATSIGVAQAIQDRFSDPDDLADVGRLSLHMSGCINACGHHHTGHIGILGIDKRGEEAYQIGIGGSPGVDDADPAKVARILGAAIPRDDVPEVIGVLVETYRALRLAGETFLQTVDRVGVEPFKERVYG